MNIFNAYNDAKKKHIKEGQSCQNYLVVIWVSYRTLDQYQQSSGRQAVRRIGVGTSG